MHPENYKDKYEYFIRIPNEQKKLVVIGVLPHEDDTPKDMIKGDILVAQYTLKGAKQNKIMFTKRWVMLRVQEGKIDIAICFDYAFDGIPFPMIAKKMGSQLSLTDGR